MKIAMWSGPRNLSTAMMYSFGNRDDFAAWDEPFYAPYLAASGIEHPMKAEILAAHEASAEAVAAQISGPVPDGREHWYMKHMPLHMLEGFPLAWAEDCVNVHLIRHPARVVASYSAKREQPTLDDIGYWQHAEMFARFPGPVIDSADVRRDPQGMLKRLCAEIGLSFDPAMLRWQAGPRSFDGIWASHWYGAVHQSTGFAGAEGPLPENENAALVEAALPYYEEMSARKLRA